VIHAEFDDEYIARIVANTPADGCDASQFERLAIDVRNARAERDKAISERDAERYATEKVQEGYGQLCAERDALKVQLANVCDTVDAAKLRAELAAVREALADLLATAREVRKMNTREFMEHLAQRIEDSSQALARITSEP
jgi:5'-3' exonuclease